MPILNVKLKRYLEICTTFPLKTLPISRESFGIRCQAVC